MAAWNKICCAVDFSEPSRFAMLEAADLAKRFGANLALVHVYEAPPTISSVPEVLEQAKREMDRKMESWRAEAERLAGRPVQAEVVAGEAAAEIVRFAKERFMELVVLATHGRTGVKHLVLGSVAEKVVRQADCEVLVVRRPAVPDADD